MRYTMPFFHDANEEFRDLNHYEKNVIYLTVFGGFFACFDFTVYFYFNDIINQAFFPDNMSESLKSVCFLLLILFSLSLYYSIQGKFSKKPWLLRFAVCMLPAPWLAAELGWVVAEYGRQPWTIYGVLPTHLSTSTISIESIYGSLAGFVGFYTLLLVIEMYLMIKYIRLGAGSLGTGKYFGEQYYRADNQLELIKDVKLNSETQVKKVVVNHGH